MTKPSIILTLSCLTVAALLLLSSGFAQFIIPSPTSHSSSEITGYGVITPGLRVAIERVTIWTIDPQTGKVIVIWEYSRVIYIGYANGNYVAE